METFTNQKIKGRELIFAWSGTAKSLKLILAERAEALKQLQEHEAKEKFMTEHQSDNQEPSL